MKTKFCRSLGDGYPDAMVRKIFRAQVIATLLAIATAAFGQAPSTSVPSKWKWEQMDQGPFFTSNVQFDKTNTALKVITLRLSDGTNREAAAVAFDTMTLRWAAAWTGGFLHLPKGRDGIEGVPQPWGTVAWTTPMGPGCSPGTDFKDPRSSINQRLPDNWAKWRGLHLQGENVVLDYTIGGVPVLERVSFRMIAGRPVFTRILQFDRRVTNYSLVLASIPRGETTMGTRFGCVRDPISQKYVSALVNGVERPRWFNGMEGRLVVNLPVVERAQPVRFDLTYGESEPNGPTALPELPEAIPGRLEPPVNFFDKPQPKTVVPTYPVPADLRPMLAPKPGRWGDALVTVGKLATSGGDGPYVVDTITPPEPNPYQSWLRFSGFDFFADPTKAAICSVSGDVWLVSGLNEKLDHVTWKRFATGLFQPLGLKIVGDVVYVTCRDGILRLHDEDGDGEADFYEAFNNDVTITSHYHEFCLGLETDQAGNFYFCKGGNLGEAEIPHQGTLNRISKDGSRLETIATGFRAPNGLSIGPRDQITTADNEGNWVPASRVDLVSPGGFYGHVFTAHRDPKPTKYDGPLFWLPKNADNSSGAQVWVTSHRWGPFEGDLLHTSYGMSSLFKAFYETVDGVTQGGAVRFPLKFDSGVMRGRFSPGDGQLYICGLVIWQSNGAQKGAFHRVRYTGKPVASVRDLRVKPGGVEMSFTTELDRASTEDPANWSVERWNYKWTESYGSPEFSVQEPDRKGHDTLNVKSVTLVAADRVRMELPEIAPVMQQRVKFAIKAKSGQPVEQELWHTIHRVPAAQ